MKTLVTHINPHLDDIAAIWLFKKFHPRFKDANIEYISASHNRAESEENEDKIFLGTGGGMFDEHKEGLETAAASLVFEYLKENKFLPEDEITQKALERLVEWNKLIDTGRAPNSEFDEFSIQSIIRCKDSTPENSQKSYQLGEELLERILIVLQRKQQGLKDWKDRVEFETKFGKSYAVTSQSIDREFCRDRGGDLFLIYNPKWKSVQYFTPSFEIDLEPIYRKLKEIEADADWFLHQSHHMVICGSASAPDSKHTNLSLEQLIEVAKEV